MLPDGRPAPRPPHVLHRRPAEVSLYIDLRAGPASCRPTQQHGAAEERRASLPRSVMTTHWDRPNTQNTAPSHSSRRNDHMEEHAGPPLVGALTRPWAWNTSHGVMFEGASFVWTTSSLLLSFLSAPLVSMPVGWLVGRLRGRSVGRSGERSAVLGAAWRSGGRSAGPTVGQSTDRSVGR